MHSHLQTTTIPALRLARPRRLGALLCLQTLLWAAPSMADELDRQWLHGRVDQVSAALPATQGTRAASSNDLAAATDLESRLAGLSWNGPPAAAVVELHRRLDEVEALDRLWNERTDEPTATARPDAEGRFRLRTPDAGPWRLVVRAPGFLPMEVVPPSVPDVIELGTVWMVPSRPVDLGSRLTALARPPVEGARGARAWLASDDAEHAALRLQSPLHGWRPLPVRSWWRGGSAPLPVPRGGARTVWVVPAMGGARGAERAGPIAPLRLVVEADGSVTTIPPTASPELAVARLVVRRPDAGPSAARCQGLLDERPLGPLENSTVVSGSRGARLRVVCPEGTGRARLEPSVDSAGPAGAPRPLEVEVSAPRLPSIQWRLEGSGQTVDRVTLVSGTGTVGTVGTVGTEGTLGTEITVGTDGADHAEPPLAAMGAVTRDPAVGWVEVRAAGIAGGRVPATDLLAGADAAAGPGASAAAGDRPIVEAWLRRPSLIEGWVRGDFGDGVPGVDVVAVETRDLGAAASGLRAVWGRTDAEGRFRLRDVPPDRPLLIGAISREHPPRAVIERSPSAGARRQDVRLDLARPLDLVGWVVDSTGRAVAGAAVTLREVPAERRVTVLSSRPIGVDRRRVATTDEQGRFVFADAEPTRLSLDVRAPGLASTFVSGVEPRRTDALVRSGRLEIELGTFEMVPERRVALRVIDRDGAPVPGALISWTSSLLPGSTPLRFASRSPYRENPLQPVWQNVDADRRGEAVLGGIEEQATVTVLVEASGFVPHLVDELVLDWNAERLDPVEVTLTPEARIAGRVERADGSPLADAYVALHSADVALDLGSPSMRTGDDGRFSFGRLPPGDLRVTVNAVDEAAIDPLEITLGVGQEIAGLVLRAPPSARVEGRVVQDGAPLEGVSVTCCGDLARTDAAGVFAIARARLGPQSLEVRLRGRDDHVTPIEVRESGNWFEIDVTHDPDLDRPRRTLRGRLRGSAEVEQRILDRRLGLGLLLRSRSSGETEPVLLDGLDFGATDIPADRYLLTAVAPGTELASVAVDLQERDVTDLVVDLDLEREQTLLLTVENADERSSEGWFRYGLPLLLRGENGLVTSRVARWSTEDDYLLDPMSPGRWTIEAETADGRRRASTQVDVPADAVDARAVLVFEQTERERIVGTLRVDGAPSSGWIMVRSLGAMSASVPGLGVVDEIAGHEGAHGFDARPDLAEPSASARANSLGQFEFAAAPGPARLLVSTGSSALGWFDVDLRPGVPLVLDLARQVVVGRVEHAAGGPVAGRTVIARDQGAGAYRGRATTDAAGGFVIEMLTEQGAWPDLEVAVEGARDSGAWTPVEGGVAVVRLPAGAPAGP